MSIPAQSRSAVCLARFLAFACLAALLCARPARADEGVITPESAEGQNIANAADLLEKFGAVDVANRVRDRLKSGQYSYKTGMKHNAETGTGSQYTAISPEIIRLPGILRDKPFDPDKRFDMIFALARTLYHEDVHSGQGYFSSLWGELPGETTYETDAWSKTIAAETAWIMNGMVLRTLTPQQLNIMTRDLDQYIASFQENDFYGLPQSLRPMYLGLQKNMQLLGKSFEQATSQAAAEGGVSSEVQQAAQDRLNQTQPTPANAGRPPATPASASACSRYADCPPALDWCERAKWFREQAAKERLWAQESRQAGRQNEAEGFEHMAHMDDSMAAIRDREAEYAYRECQRKRGLTTATGLATGAPTAGAVATTPVTFPVGPQDCRFYRQMAADARKDAEFWKKQVAIDEARIRDASAPEVKQTAGNDLQKDQERVRDREQKAAEWERKLAACPEEYRTAVDSPPPATATGTGTGAAGAPAGSGNAVGGATLTPAAGAPQQPCPTQADCDKLCAAAAQAEKDAAAAKAALEQAEADRQRDLDKANQAEKDAEMQKYNRDNRISVNMEIAAQRRAYAKMLRDNSAAAVAKAKAEAEAKAKAAAEARAACDACRPCPEETKTAMKTGTNAAPLPPETVPGQTAVSQPPAGANATGAAPGPVSVGSAALGDVNGSGTPQVIIGAVPGSPPQVQVLDGATGQQLSNFLAYPPSFIGGVHVAVGDLNGDGKLDIITGPGSGGTPQVKVFNATGRESNSFFTYNPSFTGGVYVAAGDVNGDGNTEVITGPGPGGPPQVKVFNGSGQEMNSFFAFNPSFTGGVYVAAGDLDGDGNVEIITGAGPGGAPQVKVFNGTGQEMNSFFAFNPSLTSGVNVAVGDVNGDDKPDIITGSGSGSTPQLKAFNGMSGEEYKSEFLGGIEFEVARSVSLGVRYVHRSIPRVLEDYTTAGATGLTPEEQKKACEAALGDKPCENLGAIHNTESGFIGGRYMGNPGVDLNEDFFTGETDEGATYSGGVLENLMEVGIPSSLEKPATGEKPSDTTLFSPSFTGLRFSFTFDGSDAGTTPATDPEKQSILTDAGEGATYGSFAIPHLSPNEHSRTVARSLRTKRVSQSAFQLVAYRTGGALPLRSQAASASQSAPPSKPTPTTQPAPMLFSIASNGKTGDEALQLQVFDPSSKLKQIRLRPGVVLEPLKQTGAAPKPFAERHAGAAAGKLLTQQITALCLDFIKLPPATGTLYRIAPRAVQEKFKPLSSILEAGHKLAKEGKLHPDSEPKAYSTFIRQFALWTKLENWDAAKFTEMFLQHSKKSAEVQKFQWTKEVENELLAAAPGRWRDVTAVLAEAEAISKASVTKSSD